MAPVARDSDLDLNILATNIFAVAVFETGVLQRIFDSWSIESLLTSEEAVLEAAEQDRMVPIHSALS